jgi:Flp pilus assembly protein TadG
MISRLSGLPYRIWQQFVSRPGEVAQAVVEMALVLPVIVVLLVGTVDVGDAINSYLTVIDVGRDSARLGSKGMATDTDIRNMAVTEMSRLRDTFNPATDMTITRGTFDGDTSIKVQVCSNHSVIMPGLSIITGNSFRMCSSTRMRTITSN